MRIKRFIAPDMRTALRMVRDEQGPDAVILSNRPCEDGVEVVCATDYDEALVQQALRSAAPKVLPQPAAATAPAPVAGPPIEPAPAAATPALAQTRPQARAEREPRPASGPAAAVPSVRETLASRARAVFRIGDTPTGPQAEPTLAELTADATTRQTAAPQDRHSRVGGNPWTLQGEPNAAANGNIAQTSMDSRLRENDEQKQEQKPPSRFEEMMAVLNPTPAEPMWEGLQPRPEVPADGLRPEQVGAEAPPTMAAAGEPAPSAPLASHRELSLEPAPELDQRNDETATETPKLHAVPRWDADPTVAAMREELASMRHLIEREMGQFAIERLRGSPARAAAFDLLLGYGCEDHLAQNLAAKIEPTLDPGKVRAPVLAELARLLRIRRDEPIEDGGVIALIGPTGAGKTTTAAKLAARFAARHRTRDVALVTTDAERVGAREQLHAHGRKLGITVCEAHGPEALAQTLEQLQDYPLVIVDTAGFGARDRALLGQITWLRATRNVRSLLVLPANTHPHDMTEVVRRYRMASPEGVVLTKLDETGRLGAALSVLLRSDLPLAYTTDGQQVASDLAAADASHLVLQLEKLRRAADNPLATEDRHVVA